MLIPDDAKPHEIGIYIAYLCLGIKDPRELQRIFHYKDYRSVNKILRKLRNRGKNHIIFNPTGFHYRNRDSQDPNIKQ
jgi:hypothetical protein